MTYDAMVQQDRKLCEELVAQHDEAIRLGFVPVEGHTEQIEAIRAALTRGIGGTNG